jgi:hypothetical protein
MHEEGSPEAQADAQETGSFVLQYAPFVLEALARGIAGGWRTEVRWINKQTLSAPTNQPHHHSVSNHSHIYCFSYDVMYTDCVSWGHLMHLLSPSNTCVMLVARPVSSPMICFHSLCRHSPASSQTKWVHSNILITSSCNCHNIVTILWSKWEYYYRHLVITFVCCGYAQDGSIRQAAQKCASSLGRVAAAGDKLLDADGSESKVSASGKMQIVASETPLEIVCGYLVPRVRGEVAGMDTASHRKWILLDIGLMVQLCYYFYATSRYVTATERE